MSEENVLETVKRSINDYCAKQKIRGSIKVFSLIIDNDEENKVVAIGIDSVLALIRKVFNYEISAYSIQIVDPDDRKPIISLMQNAGYQWDIIHNAEAE